MKYTKILIIALILVSFALMYLIIFGRALKQKENHVRILLALPKVVLTSKAARIDDRTYLAKNPTSFTGEMQRQGFSYVEQFGAGYIFEKDEEKYVSISRMYSSYFRIFTQPARID